MELRKAGCTSMRAERQQGCPVCSWADAAQALSTDVPRSDYLAQLQPTQVVRLGKGEQDWASLDWA